MKNAALEDLTNKTGCRIVGIGIDTAEVSRIASMIDRHGDSFLSKIYTDSERTYCDSRAVRATNYAARFAAKEAMAKALGTGFNSVVTPKGLSVENDSNGAPKAVLDEPALRRLHEIGASKILLSLTHTKEYAQAIAIAVG